MTSRFGAEPYGQALQHRPERNVRSVPLGLHTRYLLRSYFHHSLVVTLGITAVALTIDLTQRLASVLESRPDADGKAAVVLVGWYAILRSADILARNLPISLYLGVLWSEFEQTLSGERVIVAAGGRSPLQCLIPVLIFGSACGIAQWTLDLWLRPAAVMTQVSEHLGQYGQRFDRRPMKDIRWIRVGRDLVSARVEYGPPSVLHDVTLYRLTTGLHPQKIVIARMAVPSRTPSFWSFIDGYSWEWTDGSPPAAAPSDDTSAMPGPTRPFSKQEIKVELDAKWIPHMGINAKYLPQAELRQLAWSDIPQDARIDFQTWLHVRYARALFVLGMVLLGASLAHTSLTRIPPLYGLLGILLCGYFGQVAMKTFEIMGELGTVPPLVAGWLVPVALVVAAMAVQWNANRSAP